MCETTVETCIDVISKPLYLTKMIQYTINYYIRFLDPKTILNLCLNNISICQNINWSLFKKEDDIDYSFYPDKKIFSILYPTNDEKRKQFKNWYYQNMPKKALINFDDIYITNFRDIKIVLASFDPNYIVLNNNGTVDCVIYKEKIEKHEIYKVPDVKSIKTGLFHYVLLKNNETIETTETLGNNKLGQCNIPEGVELTNVKNIACGEHHSVALKNDGTIGVFGNIEYFRVPVLTDVCKVVSGGNAVFALKKNGEYAVFGRGYFGEYYKFTKKIGVPVRDIYCYYNCTIVSDAIFTV